MMVDLETARLRLASGADVALGRRGAALLAALLAADGAPVAKDELMDAAWPGLAVGEANLSVQVAALRKTLSDLPGCPALIVTVPRIGYRLQLAAAPIDRAGLPSILVQPIVDLSGSSGQLATAIGQGIAAALSRFASLAVIPPRTAGGEAAARDARFAVSGCVQQHGARLRVVVHLVDTASGLSRWSAQLDGAADEPFALQDRVVDTVAASIEPAIRRVEIDDLRRRPPERLDAYHRFLQALPHLRGTSEASRLEAIRLLDLTVAADPGFATALAYAAWARERQDTFGPGLAPPQRDEAVAMAEKALLLSADDPLVQAVAALVLLNLTGERDRALTMLGRAEAAAPHNATVLSLYAFANVMVGDVARGREAYLRTLAIAPGAFENYELLVGVALAHLFEGAADEAVRWSLDSIAQNADWLGAYWTLTAAYMQSGRTDEARATVSRLLRRAPNMRMADIERIGRRYHERFQVVVDALRLAELPD